MNISLFSDWLEERLFGEGELAHLIADIVDEAMASNAPGDSRPSENVDEALLTSAWRSAENEDELVRARTAVVLGRLGHAPVAEAVEAARHCSDHSVARAATIVTARLRGVNGHLLEGLLETAEDPATPRELRSSAARAIAASESDEAVQELIRVAGSEDPDLAQYGVEGLGHVRIGLRAPQHDAVLEALVHGLEWDESEVRLAAVEALGEFGDTAAMKPLEMILIEKDPAIRRRALFALAKLGAASARPPLTRMVRDRSVPARWEIVDLLGTYYGEEVVDALAEAATDPDAEIRDHIVSALARMDGPDSLDLLRKIAREDRDSFVSEQAVAALESRGASPTAPAAPAAAERPPAEAPAPPTAAPPPPPGPPGELRPLYGAAAPEAPPPAAEPTNVIERALESLECTWSLGPDGYHVELHLANAREDVRILLNELDFEESPVYRFVVDCGPVRPEAYETALQDNRVLDYGALAVCDVGGTRRFVLTETIPAGSAPIAGVRKALTSLARNAAHLRGS